MDAEARYRQLVGEIRREFPHLRLIKKSESTLQRAIHQFLRVVTLGGMSSYLDSYQTTIGYTIYLTDDWDRRDPRERYCTLRHEAVHLRQFRRFTWPGMALLYVLLPVPFGLAYFRARFEMAAYEESIRAAAEVYGPEFPRQPAYRDRILAQFCGPSYGWMWPFRGTLERWYDGVLESLPVVRPAPQGT